MPFRGFLVLFLFCLLLSSGFLLLIFGPASYQQVQALNQQTYHEGGYRHLTLTVTPASFQLLRVALALLAGSSASLLLALSYFRKAELREDTRVLRQEFRNAVATLGYIVRQ